MKEKRERRNLILYSTGKTISIFGTSIYSFALSLYVLKLTGSGLSFAVTLILGIIPMIIMNPFAGVIADKFNKKTIVVTTDLLNGILLISVYLICMKYELTLGIIYATTFLLTVFTTFFGIGMEAAKPNIVSEKRLMSINSISKIIDSVSSILGPMLGGIVFAILDIRMFIIINGISFIFSGLSMLLIDFKLYHHQAESSGKIHVMNDIKEGFQYLVGKKNIMSLFILLISMNFFLGFAVTVPLPYIINTVLKLGAKEFGIIQGAFPVGMIIGALFVKKVTARVSFSALLKYLSFTLAIFMVLSGIPVMLQVAPMGSSAYTAVYCVIMFIFGLAVAFIDIPLAYFMQKEIPDEYRGRVMSIGISIGKTMLPLAMILAGVLLNYLPAYIMPVAGGFLFLLFNMRPSAKINIEITSESVGT